MTRGSLRIDNLTALRYSLSYEPVLAEQFGRNRIFVELAAVGERVLEFGCADGFISRHLTESGCRVTAVEVDPEAAERARQWCEQVLVHDLNRLDWTQQLRGKFDTVLCGDVLEHLVDPDVTLNQIPALLTPSGRVIISLPNIAHIRTRLKLFFGKFEYESTGIMDVTHLRFYTQKAARELIESAGFRINLYQPLVGGSVLTRWLRIALHKLFARGMMFVAVPLAPPEDRL